MWNKNNGRTENEILQNRFTAYITSALQHCRRDYTINLAKWQERVILIKEIQPDLSVDLEEDALLNLPVMMRLQNEKLLLALQTLGQRELYVLLSCALREKELSTLASELNLSYKGVAAIYYRALEKLRKLIRGYTNEF